MENGLVVMDDLAKRKGWSHCNGWPTQVEKRKEWFHCNGWPTQVEERSHFNGWPTQVKKTWRMQYLKDECSKAHLKGGRVRKCNTWEVRAQRCTQKEVKAQRRNRKEVLLENALPKRWWWNTNLTMLKAMHYDQYACILTWDI